jgi:biotin carboxyl carrier protein
MTNSALPEKNNKKKMNSKEPGKLIPPDDKKVTVEDQKEMKEKTDHENKSLRYKSLVIDSTKYRTLYNSKFINRKKWINPDHNKIISHIPGTIVKVFVTEDQQVQEGDSILILEAMKMKNRLVFHKSGRVKTVRVSEGQKVPKHYVMVELE